MTVQDRASNIQEMFEKSSKDSTFTEFLGNWNMKMDPKLVTLQGKVLSTNTVVFAGGKEESGTNWNFRDKQLIKAPSKVENWFIVCPKGKVDDMKGKFLPLFLKHSYLIGLQFSEKVEVIETSDYRKISKLLRPKDEFVLIILERDTQYQEVQKIVKEEIPIISQCCLISTAQKEKGLVSIITNLAIQIATKLGGTPWNVKNLFFKYPTMIVGISTVVKDTLAFTSTYGQNGGEIYSRVGSEKQLKEFFLNGLYQFYKSARVFPFQMIIYRDGLTEGIEEEKSKFEIKLIDELLQSALDDENKKRESPMPKVEIAYISCSKNNLTRLFSQKQQLVNPPPGTVLDHTIINNGFYLFAADVRQGSGTPVRFQICL